MGLIIWPGQTPDDAMPTALPTWVEGEEQLERAEIRELIREGLEWKRIHDKPDALGLKLNQFAEECFACEEIELSAALTLVAEIRTTGGANGLMELVRAMMADIKRDQRCRICGCTNHEACPGGCEWVEADLCSRCAEAEDVDLIQRMH